MHPETRGQRSAVSSLQPQPETQEGRNMIDASLHAAAPMYFVTSWFSHT